MNAVVSVLAVLAVLSLPATCILEGKCGRGKKAKLIHGILAAAGVLSLGAVYLLFTWKIGSAAGDVRGWAEDFFFSYFRSSVILTACLSGLFALAAAINHPMRRIRTVLAVLLSLIAFLASYFVAFLASEGQFAVDLYIRALSPGLGLLPHAVPLCERRKKSD